MGRVEESDGEEAAKLTAHARGRDQIYNMESPIQPHDLALLQLAQFPLRLDLGQPEMENVP